MEIDLSILVNNLISLLSKYTKYEDRVVLSALSVIELLKVVDSTLSDYMYTPKQILEQTIRPLQFLSRHISFNVKRFEKIVLSSDDMTHPIKLTGLDEIKSLYIRMDLTDSFSSEFLSEKINQTMRNERLIFDRIIKCQDHPQRQSLNSSPNPDREDQFIYTLVSKLFNIIDSNQDGLITATDALYALDTSHNYPLLFEYNFSQIVIGLLLSDVKIDYDIFRLIFI